MVWLMIAAGVVFLLRAKSVAERAQEIPFSELVAEAQAGHVDEVAIQDREYTVKLKQAPGAAPGNLTKHALGPVPDKDVLESLKPTAKELPAPKVTFESEGQSGMLLGLLITFAPMLLIGLMLFSMMRQMQAGNGKAMSFGKSKARLLNESQNRVTFADVAGADEAKDEVEEIIAFLKDPKKFQRLGGRIPKGVLMVGSPGTGKTLLARAIAGEAKVPFFSISGSDFVEMFVGVGASRVRDLFEQGKKNAPCIIFIDEIDAVGRHRGAGMGGGHDEREQTLNQLLVEMDGFEANDGVILIAATNRPDVLDPAILRPGRFDRRITVSKPDVKGREAILAVHTRKTPLGPDVDLSVIARGTPGLAGADLENLVNEAALLAARQDKESLSMTDFELAKDKVFMGTERRSRVISEESRWLTAVHESGHALIGVLIDHWAPVHKVSIIPRGGAGGVTWYLPKGDSDFMQKEQMLSSIATSLGGRIAEDIVLGKISSGASDDIRKATDIARAMVCEYGMSDKLGPLRYGKGEESVFLGRDYGGGSAQNYSEETARQIDEEVRNIIQTQFDRVKELLTTHRDKIERLATQLLERETMDAEEILASFENRELPKREKVVIQTYAEKESAPKDKKKTASIFVGGGTPEPVG